MPFDRLIQSSLSFNFSINFHFLSRFASCILTSIQTVDTKSKAVRLKLVDALISLTKSSSEDLQMRALRAMTSMASILPNHLNFQKAWHGLDHNLQELLCRMLESTDSRILEHGLSTCANLLEKGGDQMMNLVVLSDTLKPGRMRVAFLAIGVPSASEGLEGESLLLLAEKAVLLMLLFKPAAMA